MLRGLFRRGGKDDAPRKVAHAWELRPGDFIKLALTAPEGLSGAELQVSSVHAADLGGAGKLRRVLMLDGKDGPYSLWRDGRDRLAIGRELLRPVVEQLFDIDEFARLFDPDEPANLTLERRTEPAGLDGWTGPVYRQEGATVAYWHDRDPDDQAADELIGEEAEGFDHYRLTGDRRKFALEVAVFDGGRTDVTVIVLAPESIVEEMWTA